MAGGRLDEAFSLLVREDVRSHRRGQELVGKLAAALVERGRQHLAADRAAQAAADCEKAARLAGNTPAVAALQAAVAEQAVARQRRQQERQRVLAAARQQMERAHWSAAGTLLADLSGRDGNGLE